MKLADDPRRILAPTDLSAHADEGVAAAAALAARNDAELLVLHVVDYKEVLPAPPTPTDLETRHPGHIATPASVERLLSRTRPEVEAHVRELVNSPHGRPQLRVLVEVGMPPDAIIACAGDEHVDLVVLSTHGRTGLARVLIGSVAEQVVRRAPCPVLTLRPGG